MYERVVVPLDGSDRAEAAIVPAAAIAGAAGVPVTLVTVWQGDPATREVYLKEAAARAVAASPLETAVIDSARPGEAIAALADTPGTLLCMASHARGGVGQAILGSVAADVVHRHTGEVLLVGPHFDASRAVLLERVVVPVDGSPLSEAVLDLIEHWAVAFDLRVHLVQVIDPDAIRQAEAAGIDVNDIREDAYLARVAAGLREKRIEAAWDVLHGDDAAATVADYVRDLPASFVAMSTHGRSGLAAVTMGSVATGILRRATCPVLVVRPDGLVAEAG